MLDKICEELLYYAKCHLNLDENDTIFIRNTLLHEFNIKKPYEGAINKEYIEHLETPTPLLNEIQENLKDCDDYYLEKIMSIISPMPSTIINRFNALLKDSPSKATSYFYELMVKNNYIRKDDIKRNILWEYVGENNKLEITINLSKPEKNNKDIAKEKDIISIDYPKCMLCDSNEGFYGGGKIAARSNIRTIPIELGGENWFIQYSPYAYFNEHMIAIDKKHVPMVVDKKTIEKELDFVDILPNYFIGCNSDLPIVGGSMLSHHHFQGGEHLMPMMYARDRYNLKSKKFPNVKISYLDWFNSCLRLKSTSKTNILDCAAYIIELFQRYDDKEASLISKDENGRHSTCTTITRKIGNEYNIYIILRNNRCNSEYPDGIFHAHKEYHNIKHEGIGLIEAMGLFILPGRLVHELDLIENILCEAYNPISDYLDDYEELDKHKDFIYLLSTKYGRHNTKEQAKELVRFEIGNVCENILINTSIYKNTIDSQLRLMEFFNRLSFEVIK